MHDNKTSMDIKVKYFCMQALSLHFHSAPQIWAPLTQKRMAISLVNRDSGATNLV